MEGNRPNYDEYDDDDEPVPREGLRRPPPLPPRRRRRTGLVFGVAGDSDSGGTSDRGTSRTVARVFAGEAAMTGRPNHHANGGARQEAEEETEEDEEFLSWSSNEGDDGGGATSYSDWTITILTATATASGPSDGSGGAVEMVDVIADERRGSAGEPTGPGASAATARVETSYSVHKCMLAVGPRKSLYFKRVFDHGFSERRSSASRIELDPLAAAAFPAMLDYAYGAARGTKLAVDEATAVPLRFLAQYFEIPALHRALIDHVKANLSPANCHVYCSHAAIFRDETVMQAVEALCASKPAAVCAKNPAVFEATSPEFWLRVVDSWHPSALRRRGSTVLSHLLRAYRDRIDGHLFGELTAPRRLPVVRDPDLARNLLELERSLLDPNLSEGVTTLQDRCVDALASHQQAKGNAETEKEVTEYLKQRHPMLLGGFLLRILEHERSRNARSSISTSISTSSPRGGAFAVPRALPMPRPPPARVPPSNPPPFAGPSRNDSAPRSVRRPPLEPFWLNPYLPVDSDDDLHVRSVRRRRLEPEAANRGAGGDGTGGAAAVDRRTDSFLVLRRGSRDGAETRGTAERR